jgi:hypothetical protein
VNPIFAFVSPDGGPAGSWRRSLRVHVFDARSPESVPLDHTALELGPTIDIGSGHDRFTVADRKVGHVFSPQFN